MQKSVRVVVAIFFALFALPALIFGFYLVACSVRIHTTEVYYVVFQSVFKQARERNRLSDEHFKWTDSVGGQDALQLFHKMQTALGGATRSRTSTASTRAKWRSSMIENA